MATAILVSLLPTLEGLNIGSAYDYRFLTLQPTYSIVDWAAAQPILTATGSSGSHKRPCR